MTTPLPSQLPSPTPTPSTSTEPAIQTSASKDDAPSPFPRVGDTFKTLDDLKLACYSYAMTVSPPISLSTRWSGAQYIHLGCSVGYDKRSVGYDNLGLGPCPCVVHGARHEGVGDGDEHWVVTASHEGHEAHSRVVDEAKVRKGVQRLVDKVLHPAPPPRRYDSPTPRPPSDKRVAAKVKSTSGDMEDYPAMTDVRDAVGLLLQNSLSTLLSIPSPSALFPTARELLIAVYAACTQQNVQVYRWSPTSVLGAVRLKCQRGHASYTRHGGEMCNYRLELEKGDGGWFVREEVGVHNHPVGNGEGDEGVTEMTVDLRRDEGEAEVDSGWEGEEDEEEEDTGEDDKRPSERRERLAHLPLSQIRARIKTLTEGPPLQFPLPTHTLTFPDHDTLRIYILAAAIQRGFSLYLSGTSSNPNSFFLSCTLGHSRFGATRCGFALTVALVDGRWRTVASTDRHNHPVADDDSDGHRISEIPSPPTRAAKPPPSAATTTETQCDTTARQSSRKRTRVPESDDESGPYESSSSRLPLSGAVGETKRLVAPLPPRSPTQTDPISSRLPAPTHTTSRLTSASTSAHNPSAYGPTSSFRLLPRPVRLPLTQELPARHTQSTSTAASTSHHAHTYAPPSPSDLPPPAKRHRHLPTGAGASSSRPPPPAPPPFLPPPKPPTFLPSLQHFLHHLSPSLSAHAPTFLAVGLDRVERLATLLVLPDHCIAALVKEMEAGLEVGAELKRLPPLLGILFRKGVERAREGARQMGQARAEEGVKVEEEEEEPMLV